MIRRRFAFGVCGLLTFVAGPRNAHGTTDAEWTLSIELSTRDIQEVVDLIREIDAGRGAVTVSASGRTIRVAGPPSKIDRLAQIIRQVDDPDNAGHLICNVLPDEPACRRLYDLCLELDLPCPEDGPIELPVGPGAR